MDHVQAFNFLNDVKNTMKKFMKGKDTLRKHFDFPADPAALPGFLESVKGTEPTDEWKKFPVIITVSNDLALRGTNRKVQLQKRHSGTTFDKPQLEMQKGTLPNFTILKPNVTPRRSKDPVLAIANSPEYGAPLEPTQWSSPWSGWRDNGWQNSWSDEWSGGSWQAPWSYGSWRDQWSGGSGQAERSGGSGQAQWSGGSGQGWSTSKWPGLGSEVGDVECMETDALGGVKAKAKSKAVPKAKSKAVPKVSRKPAAAPKAKSKAVPKAKASAGARKTKK